MQGRDSHSTLSKIHHTAGNDNMEIDDTFAKEHIHKWTKAWNNHNIREILSPYSENISLSSPK